MRRLLFAAGLLTAALPPAGVPAQERGTSPPQMVTDSQEAYDSAKATYQADSAKVQSIQRRWDELFEQLGAARDRGENDEVRRLSGLLQELAEEKTRMERQAIDSRAAWTESGEILHGDLDDYLDELSRQIQNSPLGADDEASDLYIKYEDRLEKLENELPPEQVEIEPMPELEISPGDGPREITNKLTLLKNRAEGFQELLDELNRDIEALERRRIRERRMKDHEADKGRFSDDEFPTGGVRTNVTGGAQISDTAAVKLTLEDRIERKRDFRDQVEEELGKLKEKVKEFEARLGGG